MTLARARILKAADLAAAAGPPSEVPSSGPTAIEFPKEAHAARLARRIPRAVVEAREHAERIVSEANANAAAILADARASASSVAATAAQAAAEHAVAKITAQHLALRIGEERRAERELDHTIALAALLAERVIGEAIAVDPSRIAKLAESALSEARGARRMRVEAAPDDVTALRAILGELGDAIASIEANGELQRGSLVVHTELGRIDARLGPQLARLAEALREALRGGAA